MATSIDGVDKVSPLAVVRLVAGCSFCVTCAAFSTGCSYFN